MSRIQLARRYAKALFGLCATEESRIKIEKNYAELVAVIASEPILKEVVESPILAKNAVLAVINDLLAKIKADKVLSDFIAVLVKNGRVKYLAEVHAAFLDLVRQAKNEEIANVTTRYELDSKQVTEIEKILSDIWGKTIIVRAEIDPAILGGVVVRVGSKMFDASLSGQLAQLALHSKQAIM